MLTDPELLWCYWGNVLDSTSHFFPPPLGPLRLSAAISIIQKSLLTSNVAIWVFMTCSKTHTEGPNSDDSTQIKYCWLLRLKSEYDLDLGAQYPFILF